MSNPATSSKEAIVTTALNTLLAQRVPVPPGTVLGNRPLNIVQEEIRAQLEATYQAGRVAGALGTGERVAAFVEQTKAELKANDAQITALKASKLEQAAQIATLEDRLEQCLNQPNTDQGTINDLRNKAAQQGRELAELRALVDSQAKTMKTVHDLTA